VYAAPFGSADEARAQCETLGFQPAECHPKQPGAPS
jgi:hypothetical protein